MGKSKEFLREKKNLIIRAVEKTIPLKWFSVVYNVAKSAITVMFKRY